MGKVVILQRQVSQLDEPVYSQVETISPTLLTVIYWNDYGYIRKDVDPELGKVPDFGSAYDNIYDRKWVDSKTQDRRNLLRLIRTYNPSLVVFSDIPNRDRLLLAAQLRLSGIPVGLRSDKNLLSGSAHLGVKLIAERLTVRLLYNVLFPISPLTTDYYKWPSKKTAILFPYTTDENKFQPCSDLRNKARQKIRLICGIPERYHVFVSAAKFVDRENPLLIVRSYAKVAQEMNNVALIAIGDGPLMSEIRSFCFEKKVNNIFFPGYVAYRDLQDYFFAGDTFLHLSKMEPWGVSPQDALISGLNLIASDRVGSAVMLLSSSLKRFCTSLDSQLIAERMKELASQTEPLRALDEAKKNATEYTVGATAQRLASLADSRSRSPSVKTYTTN